MWSDIETSKDILSFSVHLNKAERETLQLLSKHCISVFSCNQKFDME